MFEPRGSQKNTGLGLRGSNPIWDPSGAEMCARSSKLNSVGVICIDAFTFGKK